MRPQDLRDLIGRMTAGEWFTSPHIDQQRLTIDDAVAIKALRNLAPALVELWEAVERWADATKDCEEGCGCRQGQDAIDALLAAAKRLGEAS